MFIVNRMGRNFIMNTSTYRTRALTIIKRWLFQIHTDLGQPERARRIAAFVWAVPFLAIAVFVGLCPTKRSVTPLYHDAVGYWHAHISLYTGPSGMNYLPSFVVLFRPFHALPSPLGDIAWRAFSIGMLAWGIWRFVRLRFRQDTLRSFIWVSVLSLPLSLSCMRNGQSTVLLTACLLLAVASLGERQWWRAAVFCALGLVMKPLAVVLVMLVPFVYPRMLWRLPITLAVVLGVPFLFADSSYVLAQYWGCLENLRHCAGPTRNQFADINGLLRIVGLSIPLETIGKVCAAAGLPTLMAWMLLARKTDRPFRAIWLFTLTAVYLMLFNPMNEANSYITLVPAMAFWTVEFLVHSPDTRRTGVVFIFLIASMAFLDNALRPLLGSGFSNWWYPLVTVVWLWLTFACCRRHKSDYFCPEM
jgi:hypothetical protein